MPMTRRLVGRPAHRSISHAMHERSACGNSSDTARCGGWVIGTGAPDRRSPPAGARMRKPIRLSTVSRPGCQSCLQQSTQRRVYPHVRLTPHAAPCPPARCAYRCPAAAPHMPLDGPLSPSASFPSCRYGRSVGKRCYRGRCQGVSPQVRPARSRGSEPPSGWSWAAHFPRLSFAN